MSDRHGIPDVRFSTLLAGQNDALQRALGGAPLREVLEVLVRTAEAQSDRSFLASILLLDEDGRHLRHGAAPSLPQAYNEAIDGVAIGPAVGSCGTAAHCGHAIVVTDIARDPLWADFRELALAHGLQACWSTPFLAKDKSVLGTLALYYREPRAPSENDREIVKLVGNTAALIIENARLHARMQDLNERVRLAVDVGGLGLFTWEIDADTVTWQNDRPYAILGVDRAEGPVTGQRFVSEFLHPDDREAFAQAVSQALQGGAAFHFEGRILRKADGAQRRVSFTGQLDAQARARGVSRVVGVAADVTDRGNR
jgi:PAS domain S-box-containing protein